MHSIRATCCKSIALIKKNEDDDDLVVSILFGICVFPWKHNFFFIYVQYFCEWVPNLFICTFHAALIGSSQEM